MKIPEDLGNLVVKQFDGDYKKAALWWSTKNPFFGEVSPWDMLAIGKEVKVRQFITEAMEAQKKGITRE